VEGRGKDGEFNLKRKGGNVAFGDDSSAKILGEGVVELGRKNVLLEDWLLSLMSTLVMGFGPQD
jgi:hypothetical protein